MERIQNNVRTLSHDKWWTNGIKPEEQNQILLQQQQQQLLHYDSKDRHIKWSQSSPEALLSFCRGGQCLILVYKARQCSISAQERHGGSCYQTAKHQRRNSQCSLSLTPAHTY